MCDDCVGPRGDRIVSRRRLLVGAATVGAGLALGVRPTWAAPIQVGPLQVHPRSDWGANLPPGPLQPEPDVRFLLVHHTAGSNDYAESEVRAQIRQVFQYHTGPDKGWSDVCYNFFVDRYGGVWEGRAGSLAGPVMADATGGSQGFAQLVCLLGIFVVDEPTQPMVDSTIAALAFLADRYSVDTSAGAEVHFISRGSNKWPAGTAVTARTISGHRDMSATECPGQKVYDLLAQEIPARVNATRAGATPAVQPTTLPTVAPVVPQPTLPSTTTVPVPSSTAATTTTTAATTSSPTTESPAVVAAPAASPSTAAATTASSPSIEESSSRAWAIPSAIAAVGTGLLAAGIVRRQRAASDRP